jgi:hypothetical protein
MILSYKSINDVIKDKLTCKNINYDCSGVGLSITSYHFSTYRGTYHSLTKPSVLVKYTMFDQEYWFFKSVKVPKSQHNKMIRLNGILDGKI